MMNDQNEVQQNQGGSAQPQTGSNPVKKSMLVIVFYSIVNILYFLLFLASCPYVLLSPMVFDGGDSISARITFILVVSFPIIIIALLGGAGYFYRKGRIKATFIVLLLPPLLYLVFMLIQAFYWSL
ncbi:MAG: hypothetical protein MHPDNHAH_03034 [Anaerolineales bacterium]|nr:hypothetical protein [Anaerolineales bacterium]WKZ48629.1 MAG: hypothetical protein QY306_04560 [Anaerolineales bacterium]